MRTRACPVVEWHEAIVEALVLELVGELGGHLDAAEQPDEILKHDATQGPDIRESREGRVSAHGVVGLGRLILERRVARGGWTPLHRVLVMLLGQAEVGDLKDTSGGVLIDKAQNVLWLDVPMAVMFVEVQSGQGVGEPSKLDQRLADQIAHVVEAEVEGIGLFPEFSQVPSVGPGEHEVVPVALGEGGQPLDEIGVLEIPYLTERPGFVVELGTELVVAARLLHFLDGNVPWLTSPLP